jgi:succinoglycan biosynthesis transport protein ExoP
MADGDQIRGPAQQQVPTVRELAMVLFRQRKVFVTIAGVVFAAAVLYALVGAKYQASMKILVRRGRADAPVSAGENAPLDLTHLAVTEEELNSEVELLRDDDVLRKVVQQTRIGGRDWLHFLRLQEGSAERVERATRGLATKLKVEPVKKTNLIAVGYAADDPQLAAKILQSLANAYLEKHLSVHRPGGELHFFSQQAAESQRQLEESKRQLLRFTTVQGVVSAGLQRDLTLQRLSEMDANHRQAKVELAETRQRVWALERQVANLPDRATTLIRMADNPELLKELKSSLLNLELRRTQLLTKFEPNHRLVQEVDQQIAQAKLAIAAERLTPVRDETTDKSTQYEWAKSQLQQAEVQLKGLQAREEAITSEEGAYRQMATKFGEAAITQEHLLSNEKAALENYLLYVKKQEQARMDDALDQRGIVNVAIAQEPIAPALPIRSSWMVVAVGLLAAGTAATGAAFVADYVNPVFRDPDDVVAYLNSPVLASLPKKPCGRLSA